MSNHKILLDMVRDLRHPASFPTEAMHAQARAVEELMEECTDLHLVAQSSKHYWGCPNNAAAGSPPGDPCLRCDVERLEEELRRVHGRRVKLLLATKSAREALLSTHGHLADKGVVDGVARAERILDRVLP